VRRSVLADLELVINRQRGRGLSGVAEVRLRPYLADTNGPIRSGFEKEFRLALAGSDLPPAQFNVNVGGFEVDVFWPGAGVIVELDGRSYHSDDDAFEADRERDAKLIARHHAVIRITWRRWREQPDEEPQRLRDLIGDRTPGPADPAAAADRPGGPGGSR
jgi:very-short-patch-repair endonuclease